MVENFDPIAFLNIQTDQLQDTDEINTLRDTLNKKIGEYVVLKLCDNLDTKQLHTILNEKDMDKVFTFLEAFIPNVKQKIQQELDSFKTAFHS